ncbi:hypothetical protein ASPTUDRAFT_706755 [Aspergillus tubingensis CBS 134.48]|uniref:Uncharacterized protein n=1 Tax=Aspergillus tubingensis (strain CBS 134.48) TaxID=767770 RepID=A0A1L9N1U5_ASPTC|nr:hypothetical protein ASPTUDRAFT_706755 [Aspergillus tubingensis CBS 134.48]
MIFFTFHLPALAKCALWLLLYGGVSAMWLAIVFKMQRLMVALMMSKSAYKYRYFKTRLLLLLLVRPPWSLHFRGCIW